MKRETFFIFGCPEYVILHKKEGKTILESQLILGRGYSDIFATIYLQPRLDSDAIATGESPIIHLAKKAVAHSVKSILSIILKIPREQLHLAIDKLSSFFVIDKNDMLLETALWSVKLKDRNGKWIRKKPFLIVTQPYGIFDVGDEWNIFGTSILFLGNIH